MKSGGFQQKIITTNKLLGYKEYEDYLIKTDTPQSLQMY